MPLRIALSSLERTFPFKRQFRHRTEPGESTGSGAVLWFYSVWYEWTAPTNGVVYLVGNTPVNDFYLHLAAFQGSAVDSLTPAPTTTDGGVIVNTGDTIEIQVASIYYPVWSGGGGSGNSH